MKQSQVMKILTIFCLLQIHTNLILSQNENCFKTETILPVRYEPSNKKKLKKSDRKEIVFKISESNVSTTLRDRIVQMMDTERDSLTSMQIEKLESVLKKYRVSVFANQTDSIIRIPHILRRITLIQEAKDKFGFWRPIETSSNQLWCGNTDHGMIVLKPNEFIEIYPRKYCGEFKTLMRMKLKLENNIIHSEEYDGFVSQDIFDSIEFPKNKFFIDVSVEEEFKRVKNRLLEKVEYSIQNNNPKNAIEFLDEYEKLLVADDNKGFKCGNGNVTGYLERLILRTKAYNLMGNYDNTIDTLLPLIFDESIFMFNIRESNVEEICSILINSLKNKYTDIEIKQELQNCVEAINIEEAEKIETHTITIFNRELKMYFMGIHKSQLFIKRHWSHFYNYEIKTLSDKEAEFRKKSIQIKIENYIREIYVKEISISKLHSRIFN